jgi:hypothetical protein
LYKKTLRRRWIGPSAEPMENASKMRGAAERSARTLVGECCRRGMSSGRHRLCGTTPEVKAAETQVHRFEKGVE